MKAQQDVNADPAQVTFVGQIRSISTQPTNITYKIDDGTGVIEAKQWIDADLQKSNDDTMDLDQQKPKLVEEGYCRVWGRLKAFNNKRHVGAHIIRPLADYNEVNYHMLEATAVHLYFTRGPPNKEGNNANGAQRTTAGANSTRNEYTSGVDSQLAGTSALARRVFATLKSLPQSNEGLHVQMLASQMGIGTNEVYKGAEELVAAGVIFTTVDESTWAVLDV
jgi:replication factor A2